MERKVTIKFKEKEGNITTTEKQEVITSEVENVIRDKEVLGKTCNKVSFTHMFETTPSFIITRHNENDDMKEKVMHHLNRELKRTEYPIKKIKVLNIIPSEQEKNINL